MLVEVQCETDFVARNEDFQEFAREVAMHIAAAAPEYVSIEEIPEDEARESERRVFEAKAKQEGKPDNVVERIVEGQLAKWAGEIALLEQEHVSADSTRARRSSSCAPNWPRRPARTSASPASPASRSASE